MTSFGFDFSERDVPPSSEELAAAWRQYIEPCIEAFGVPPLHVREQFPTRQAVRRLPTELWNAFKRITSGVSAAEKKALYSGNRCEPVSLESNPAEQVRRYGDGTSVLDWRDPPMRCAPAATFCRDGSTKSRWRRSILPAASRRSGSGPRRVNRWMRT